MERLECTDMIDVVNKSLEMCPFCDFAYFQDMGFWTDFSN